jgi:hypothetical protein
LTLFCRKGQSKRYHKKIKQIFLHGLIIIIPLAIIQMLLDNYQNNFMVFLPPIGFGFFLVISYIIQPIIVGALNVIILSRLYNTEGFQTSFWLNGLFLLLTFSTINLLIQQYGACLSPFHSPSSKPSYYQSPFGYLGKFSNLGWKKHQSNQQQTPNAAVPEHNSNSTP